MQKIASCIIALIFVAAVAGAVEIPLEHAAIGAGKMTTAIGYVDIEKIFSEHPLKKRLQDEYKSEVENRKKEIEQLDIELKDLEKVIVSSTTDLGRAKLELEILKTMTVRQEQPGTGALVPGTTMSMPAQDFTAEGSSSSITRGGAGQSLPSADPALIQGKEAAVKEKEAALEAMKKDVDTKRSDIRQKIRQNKTDLSALADKQTATVMADLYQMLQKVAADENVTIIIDKNDVLYGQASQDLTGKIRERLQGR